jgi:diacylglycerol kinase (ATP)
MARKQRKVMLIHNETAGAANHSRSEIVKLIERTGYRVRAVSSKADDLDGVLDKPADLVVVAGGDGTITKVARKMRTDGPPLGILPLGTANNIAAALSLGGSLDALISSWETGNLRPFYRFGVEGPRGRSCIVEGIGFGCIEQAIDELEPVKPSVRQAQERIAQSILTSTADELDVCLGSETLSGRFALLEITNLPFVGPRLHLAPSADPSEPLIHAIFVEDREDRRLQFSKWLLRAKIAAPAPVNTAPARRIMLRGRFRRVRLNDHNWTPSPPADGRDHEPTSIYLEAESEPIHFLVPEFAANQEP